MRGIFISNEEKLNLLKKGFEVSLTNNCKKNLNIKIGETVYVRERRFMPEREASLFLRVISFEKINEKYIIQVKKV